MTKDVITASDTEDAIPVTVPIRRERFMAFNQRVASKCFSFGGIAPLMFLVLLASGSCEDEEEPWPQRRDTAR